MTDKIDIERKAFEKELIAWWPQAAGNLQLDNGEYNNHFTNYAWWGWKARAGQETTQQIIPEIIPDGWKMVPVVPTRQMITQGHFAMGGADRGKFRRMYMAMVSAAPEQEVKP